MGEVKAKKQTKAQWKARVAEITRRELEEPESWHYVSFADEVFRGVVLIKAHGITDAVSKCHRLNINPGGQVMCVPMPDDVIEQVNDKYRNRLLTKADVLEIWPDAKSLREHEKEAESRP